MPTKTFQATLVAGHQVASGNSASSPYPEGTIAMQRPYFKKLGLDLGKVENATLNLQLPVRSLKMIKPDHHFSQVHWAKGFPAEDFSFVKCTIEYQQKYYPGWIYYPHPETKIQHFQQANLLEVLAPKIDNIHYGEKLTISFQASAFAIVD